MLLGGASIRRPTDPATDGLTDDRTRHGGDNSYGEDADSPRRAVRATCFKPSPCSTLLPTGQWYGLRI
jgi:hypothetical protein